MQVWETALLVWLDNTDVRYMTLAVLKIRTKFVPVFPDVPPAIERIALMTVCEGEKKYIREIEAVFDMR
jgi:hypothetical protein